MSAEDLLRRALLHAEWENKIIDAPSGGYAQHWKIEIRLPVDVLAADKSPEAALAAAIKL